MKTYRSTIIFAIIALVLGLAMFTPIPSIAQSVVAVHFELGGNQLTVESGGTIQAKSGSTVQFDNGATTTYAAGSTLNVPAASLVVGNQTSSGAVRFGAASNVISGTTIAHGFSVTPTTFLIQPTYVPGATFTQTLYAFGCGAISCTVGISTGSVVTFTSANWITGK